MRVRAAETYKDVREQGRLKFNNFFLVTLSLSISLSLSLTLGFVSSHSQDLGCPGQFMEIPLFAIFKVELASALRMYAYVLEIPFLSLPKEFEMELLSPTEAKKEIQIERTRTGSEEEKNGARKKIKFGREIQCDTPPLPCNSISHSELSISAVLRDDGTR